MLLGITARVFWGWGVGGGLDKQSLSGGAQSVSSTWGGGAVLCHSHLKGRATGFDSVDNL